MRLTLRTLLCYLDDVLDAADAEDLAQKIQENPQAAKLAHSIRDVTRRSRLGAPRLDGKGLAVDANTVAEYLDNTLPTENYPDFEKVCLESDMHMAEVASCHQVLALVLGGPVEVDPQLRQRMYQMGHLTAEEQQARLSERQLDSPAAPSVPQPKTAQLAAAGTAATTAKTDSAARTKAEVPDYMKVGRRSRFWPTIGAVVVGFGLTAVVLVMLGPLNENHPLARLFGGGKEVAKNPDEKPQPPAPAPEVPATPETPSAEKPEGEAPAKPEEGSPAAKVETPEGEKPAAPEVPPPGPADLGQPKPETPAAGAPEKTPVGEGPATPAVPAAPEKTPGPPGPAVALNNPAIEKEPPAKPDDAVQVARFASEDQILARFMPERQEWSRVPGRALLTAGQEFLAPPTFRPQVLVATGVQLTLDGGTHLVLGHPTGEGMPRVVVDTGRFLAHTLGKAGAAVELTLGHGDGARQLVLTFGDADSGAAIDVHNFRYPGADPEVAPLTQVIQVFCTSGRIMCDLRGQNSMTVEGGRVLNLVGEEPPSKVAAGVLPDWIDAKNLSDLDRRASRALFAELAQDRPLGLSLKEKAEDRRAEVRSLAIRALAYLDQFDAAVGALGDESLRSYWAAHVDTLSDALARDPQTAAKVRVALERARLETAKTLYRLLLGYSPEDLTKGSAAELVELLDDASLDVRVLAYENLRRITGTTLTYRPEAPRRTTTIQRWRERLKANQIVYRSLPSAISEPAAAAGAAKPPAEEEKVPPAPAPGGAPATPPPPPAPEKLPPEPAAAPIR